MNPASPARPDSIHNGCNLLQEAFEDFDKEDCPTTEVDDAWDCIKVLRGVASGKLVVIPRQEIAKFFDAYRNSVVTPQMIAGAHSEADRLVFDTLAGWLDENSASTNQGATKENR